MPKTEHRRYSVSRTASGRVTLVVVSCVASVVLSGCGFPRKDFSGVPDPTVIHVTHHNGQWQAHAPECRPLLQPSQYNDYHNLRMSIAFGCATYSNLAASVANPRDLVQPRAFSGTHADAAALAVERYRLNDIEPLRETMSTSATGE